MKQYQDPTWLHQMYWDEGKTLKEIGSLAGCGAQTILNWMIRLDIPRRASSGKIHNNNEPYHYAKWLRTKYWDENVSAAEMGSMVCVTKPTITRWMRRLGVPRRPKNTRKPMIGKKFGRLVVLGHAGQDKVHLVYRCRCDCGQETTVRGCNLRAGLTKSCGCLATEKAAERLRNRPPLKGPANANWKGGRNINAAGYVEIYAPDHPRIKSSRRYVLEHILVMEKVLERYLRDDERVHHRNGIKNDNRPENLELCAVNRHPPSQRVDDLIEFALSILRDYKPEVLHEETI